MFAFCTKSTLGRENYSTHLFDLRSKISCQHPFFNISHETTIVSWSINKYESTRFKACHSYLEENMLDIEVSQAQFNMRLKPTLAFIKEAIKVMT